MNERVIEAAVAARGEAWKTLSDEDCTIARAERHLTRAAINAALVALVPEIRTAVDVLIDAAQDAAMWSDDPGYAERVEERLNAARRDLLALLGIEDATG